MSSAAATPTVKTREHVYSMLEEIVGKKMSEIVEQRKAEREERKSEMADMIAAMGSANSNREAVKRNPSMDFGRYMRCLAMTRGDTGKSADYCKQKLGDNYVAKYLGETSFGAGGALVPPEFAAEIIPALRANSVMRSLNPRLMPMPRGNLTVPFISTGAQAAYVGEGANITKSDAATGQLVLSARKLAVTCPVSNDLIRDASPLADQVVRDDIVRSMAEREDAAFIRDDGTQNKPKGMRYWAASAGVNNETNVATGSNNSTTAEITKDLGGAIRRSMDNKVPMTRCAWVFSPRNWQRFSTERTTTGDLIWEPEMRQGMLMGYPFKVSQQIPTNLSTPVASSSTECYFSCFDGLVIGESQELEVAVFDGATYHDGTNLVSGLSQDQTVIRAITRHDFGSRYRGLDIQVILNTWGPA